MATKPASESGRPENISFFRYLRLILWGLKFNWGAAKTWFLVYIVAEILAKFRQLSSAFILSFLLDQLIGSVSSETLDPGRVTGLVALLLGSQLVFDVFDSIKNYADYMSSQALASYQELVLTRKLYDLGIERVEDPNISNQYKRVEMELYNLKNFITIHVHMISDLVRLITVGLLLINVVPVIAVLLVIFAVVETIPAGRLRKENFKFGYDNTERSRLAWNSIGSIRSLSQLPEIKILGLYNYMSRRFIDFREFTLAFHSKNQFWQQFVSLFFNALVAVVSGIGYLQIVVLTFQKVLSVGSLLFWIGNINTMYSAVANIGAQVNRGLERAIRLQEIVDFFNLTAARSEGSLLLPKLAEGPSIELKDVTFSYPNSKKQIYKKLNLTIRAGEKVAIVGENGAGKTTLVKLLAKFHFPQKGRILINDQDLADIRSDEWYKNIGVLLQDFQIYGQLSVRENVFIGRAAKPLDEKKVVAALKQADAWNFVNEYEQGLDQLLSNNFQNGIKPSTGQSQKIAIARFFYRNAPLVIFDEPTAAIDAVSEANIFNRIYDFFTGKTVIIISHRFSTVRNADRIIVLDHGEIVEQGSHQELMKLGGKYAHAFKLQAEGYQDKERKPNSLGV